MNMKQKKRGEGEEGRGKDRQEKEKKKKEMGAVSSMSHHVAPLGMTRGAWVMVSREESRSRSWFPSPPIPPFESSVVVGSTGGIMALEPIG